MYAVSGYIEKNAVKANENIKDYEGCEVIITILDRSRFRQSVAAAADAESNKRKEAVRRLAGLWKSHENDTSVEDVVRNMRRGRQFAI